MYKTSILKNYALLMDSHQKNPITKNNKLNKIMLAINKLTCYIINIVNHMLHIKYYGG